MDLKQKKYYEVGIKFEASAAWELFRCRARDENSSRVKKLEMAISLINSGKLSIREICDVTGYSKNTINTLFHKVRAFREKKGLPEIYCPCGLPTISHRGWCWYRYSKSTKRQLVIKKLNSK